MRVKEYHQSKRGASTVHRGTDCKGDACYRRDLVIIFLAGAVQWSWDMYGASGTGMQSACSRHIGLRMSP